MVLVDTSVWVDHFRRGLPALAKQLDADKVVCHPFVVGELACGNLKNRREILELLRTLCTCPVATHEEALAFIESNRLMGLGLGYIDIHLLVSAKLAALPLWTLDRSLASVAARLNMGW
ncbi:MAG TPA: PIN domain-containing protein [Sedimentisphaerales bacterium]|jgi:predicted nucleic acid-binding protein|nr:PIN domain-containing protein [Sedimentisphaerales bacterium]HNU28347.1 PIN domain-containing protein [Sedimentisphaerales bacterium]